MIQAAIDRLMHTYGMLVNLSLDEELVARKKVTQFLAPLETRDENKLAVEGIKFLRGSVTLEPGVPDRNCKMCFATGWVGENRPKWAWDEERGCDAELDAGRMRPMA
jgi:hypothetical protein